MKNFSSLHPITLFFYFISVIFIAMFVTEPVLLGLSLLGAISFYAFQCKKGFIRDFIFYTVLFIVIAAANPIFTHNGKTVLFFINGKAITLEATVYGVVISMMMVSVLYWFKSFTQIMTSDKLLYLFGRIIPKLSIVLSTSLRFIPLFRIQITRVNKAQTALGLYTKGSYSDNLKSSLRVFSIMVTWSLENAIDTADSMRARGYGIKGRTQFSIFHFSTQDMLILALCLLLTGITVVGIALNAVDIVFYPEIITKKAASLTYMVYLSYGILVFLPFIIEVKENLKWTLYKSKI